MAGSIVPLTRAVPGQKARTKHIAGVIHTANPEIQQVILAGDGQGRDWMLQPLHPCFRDARCACLVAWVKGWVRSPVQKQSSK